MKMIEIAAKAICESNGDNWNNLNHLQKVCLITNAKAVLKALLDPTEIMLEEGKEFDKLAGLNNLLLSKAAYRGMIKKALEE
jgi:hypothetical protein